MGIFGQPFLYFSERISGGAIFFFGFSLVASLFESLSIALYQYVQSQAKMWPSFFSITVPREAFLVIAAYFLVQYYGGTGLAVAYLGSTIFGLIFQFSLVAMLYRKERKVFGFYVAR